MGHADPFTPQAGSVGGVGAGGVALAFDAHDLATALQLDAGGVVLGRIEVHAAVATQRRVRGTALRPGKRRAAAMLVAALAVFLRNRQVGEREPGIRTFMYTMPADGWLAWLTVTDRDHNGFPQTGHRLKVTGISLRGRATQTDGDEQREGDIATKRGAAA
jgi:hypothetical protein